MSELAEYERRIAYALERIGRGVETLTDRRAGAVAHGAAGPEAGADTILAAEFGVLPDAAPDAAPDAEPGPSAEVLEMQAAHAEAVGALQAALAEEVGALQAAHAEEVGALQAALAAERGANEHLSDRVRAIHDKQQTTLSTLERRLVQATRALEAVQTEANRLKRANGELIEVNRALVDAAGSLAPHLVNQSMQAELEAMRAARAWEVSELADIVAGLAPIVAAHGKAQPNGAQPAGGAENG